MKAYELLNSSLKLARGNYALTNEKNGIFTNPDINPANGICIAERWDVCGALQRCYSYTDAMIILRNIEKQILEIKDTNGSRTYSSWANWNDNAKFPDIYNILQITEDKLNLTPK